MRTILLILSAFLIFTSSVLGDTSRYTYIMYDIHFDGNNKVTEYKARLKVFDDLSMNDYRYYAVNIPYDGQIKDVLITVKAKDAKPVKYKKKDGIFITSTGGSTLASDFQYLSWDLGNIKPGTKINYYYKIKEKNAAYGEYLGVMKSLQVDTTIIRMTYSSKSWRLKYSIDNKEPEIADSTDEMTFVWHDLPARNESDYKKAPYDFRPGLWHLFESKKGKNDFSNWNNVYNWSKDYYIDNQTFDKPSKMLNIANDVESIFNAIINRCRYVAIEIGEGRFCPPPPEKVWKNGYGDCKGLANLFVAWLKLAGYEAWTVKVQSDKSWLGNELFPSPFQFDHVIACYITSDGDTAFQDMTAEHCPLGYLPISLFGCFTFPLYPEAVPIRLGYAPVEPDTISYSVTGELSATGKLQGVLNIKLTGQKALGWNWENKSTKTYNKEIVLKNYLENRLPKARFENIKQNFPDDDKFNISADFSLNRFSYNKGNSIKTRPWLFEFLKYNTKIDSTRSWPTILSRNIIYKISYRIKINNAVYVDETDRLTDNDLDGFSYNIINNSHNDSLIIELNLYLAPVILAPDAYNKYVNNRRELAKHLQNGIVFTDLLRED